MHIASFLEPVDLLCLGFSCKPFHEMSKRALGLTLDVLGDQDEFDILERRLRRNWLYSPAHQICIICQRPHPRILAQPRSTPCRASSTEGAHAACVGGLRITTDCMLCQLCWTELLLRPNYWTLNPELRDTYKDTWLWKHHWDTGWRANKQREG